MSERAPGITAELAEVVAATTLDDATTAAATRCLVDLVGCAVAGARHPAVEAIAETLAVLGGGEEATLIGRAGRASPFGAALVNGAAAHVLDFDDVNVVMIGHPGVVVIPAALAVAEAQGATGADLLAGVVAGYEVAARLGAVVNPGHYERGWHATGTIGTLAAAATAARTARADAGAVARILSVAATGAAGIRAVFGSHGKALNAGRAAAAGVHAQALITAGFEAPPEALEGAGGWLRATGGTAGDSGTAGLARPAILDTAFKQHAACGATHCLIDAVAGLVGELGLKPDDIERIDAHVHRLAVQAAAITAPTSGLEAKFSLPHTAAMAVLEHPLLPAAFTDEAVADPAVVALRQRVTVSVDDSFRYDQAMPARVAVHLRSGDVLERTVDTPRGRPANPASNEELELKLVALAAPVLGEDRARRLAARLWRVAELDDVSDLAPELQP